MKRGYNELVGIQVQFSKVINRYSLVHHYRWRTNGVTALTGTMQTYDLTRSLPIRTVVASIRSVYAPCTLHIWQQTTEAYYIEYIQLCEGCSPEQLELPGKFDHWAEM